MSPMSVGARWEGAKSMEDAVAFTDTMVTHSKTSKEAFLGVQKQCNREAESKM